MMDFNAGTGSTSKVLRSAEGVRMSIPVQCRNCGKGYRCGDENAGKKFRCRECDAVVLIPHPDDEFDDFDSFEPSPGIPAAATKRSKKASPGHKRRKRSSTKHDDGMFSKDSWCGLLLAALFFFGVSIWLFFRLTNLEATGGEIRVNWMIAALYNIGGKWGAAGLPFLLAGLCLAGSIAKLARRK
jgi:hypothetical protein